MSKSELIGNIIDTAITVIIGDKISAAKQREIRRIIEAVHAGDITPEQGYGQLRYEDGDALDHVLGKTPPG